MRPRSRCSSGVSRRRGGVWWCDAGRCGWWAVVGVAGGGGGFDGAVGSGGDGPAGCLFGVVARFAGQLPVAQGGGAAVGVVVLVVVVAAGGVAEGGAAGPVPDEQELLHGGGEAAGCGSVAASCPVVGVGVEPAEHGGGLRVRGGRRPGRGRGRRGWVRSRARSAGSSQIPSRVRSVMITCSSAVTVAALRSNMRSPTAPRSGANRSSAARRSPGVQARGFPADQGGLPFGDPAPFQRCCGCAAVRCAGRRPARHAGRRGAAHPAGPRRPARRSSGGSTPAPPREPAPPRSGWRRTRRSPEPARRHRPLSSIPARRSDRSGRRRRRTRRPTPPLAASTRPPPQPALRRCWCPGLRSPVHSRSYLCLPPDVSRTCVLSLCALEHHRPVGRTRRRPQHDIHHRPAP